jgi:hypothetical protein
MKLISTTIHTPEFLRPSNAGSPCESLAQPLRTIVPRRVSMCIWSNQVQPQPFRQISGPLLQMVQRLDTPYASF